MGRKGGDKSLSFRCGLTFDISAIKKIFESNLVSNKKTKIYDSIFLTAIIEALIADFFEEARVQCKNNKKIRITIIHLIDGLMGSEYLKKIIKQEWIAVDESNRKFHTWSYKVLKQVGPDYGITNEASKCVDNIICNFIKRVAQDFDKNHNMEDVIKKIIPDDHPETIYKKEIYLKEGTKAVLKYDNYW